MRTTSKSNRRQQRRHMLAAAVAAACVGMAQSAGAVIVTWTGATPVYLADWFNGTTTEHHEFRYQLDWAGYCNAHIGSVCNAPTFWGYSTNWDTLQQPTASNDVRVPAGAVVIVSQYQSTFLGMSSGNAFAGTLAAEGTIRIGNGYLYTDSAQIARLELSLTGALVNNGLASIGEMGDSSGKLQGTGTTRVGIGGSGALVGGGHTLILDGNFSGSFGAKLEPKAKLVSNGTVTPGAADSVRLQGTANAITLPEYTNNGILNAPLVLDAVRFNNNGTVNLNSGTFSASHNGSHSGSFIGAAGTEFHFGAFGVGIGHKFLPGSSIYTDGKVSFYGNEHLVQGAYRAIETQVDGDVTFSGGVSYLPTFSANSGRARFQNLGGASIGDLAIYGGSVFFEAGPPSSVATVTLSSGGLIGTSGLDISGPFIWNSGSVAGTVGANGGITMGAGTRSLSGKLSNKGQANWNGGSFGAWSGTFENLKSGTFDLKGDFSVSGVNGGSFNNAGTFSKSAGSGIATMPVAFDNAGTISVATGRLRLSGGGTHSGALQTSKGATIELSGALTIAGPVTTSGRVDVSAGSFAVLPGGSYTNAGGNSIALTGAFSNQGSFANAGAFGTSTDSVNEGTISNSGPDSFGAYAVLSNRGTINNSGNAYFNELRNRGRFTNAGYTNAVTLKNDVTFDNLPVATLDVRGGHNAGQLINFGVFRNSGTFDLLGGAASVANSGSFENFGTLTVQPSAAIVNTGSISNQGGLFFVDVGGMVAGAGSYAQTGAGTTWIKGTLEAGGGIDIQYGLLKGSGNIVGNVTIGPNALWLPGDSPGTMTVDGNVTINGGLCFPPNPCVSNLEIEIASDTVHDLIVTTGSATFNYASVALAFMSGATPMDGDRYQWLKAASVANNGMMTTVTGLPTGWSGQASLDGSGMGFVVRNAAAVRVATSADVTVAAGTWAYNDQSGTNYSSFVNAGNFSNRPGGTLFTPGDVENQAGAWLGNEGTLAVNASFANAGAYRNRPGGVFSGTDLNNTGQVVNEGTVTVYGTLTNAPGARFDNRGSIDNAIAGKIHNQGEFVVSGTVANNAPWWGCSSSFFCGVWNDDGSFVVQPGGAVTGNGIYAQAGNWGVPITRVDGLLQASGIDIWMGALTGNGTLRGPVTLRWGAVVQPGNPPGSLTIDGNLDSQGASYEIELAGPGTFDQLVVTGDASFRGGLIRFHLLGSYVPAIGDSFAWLAVNGATNGLNTASWYVEAEYGFGGNYFWGDADHAPPGMKITMHDGWLGFTAAVPEPGTWALMLVGSALAATAARRRQQARFTGTP